MAWRHFMLCDAKVHILPRFADMDIWNMVCTILSKKIQIVPVVSEKLKQKIVITVFEIFKNCFQFLLRPGFAFSQARM